MRMYDILEKKRFGHELSESEIRYMIREYTAGNIPDYQMSAFAMAVCFAGMTDQETAIMTDAMAHSGDMMDLSKYGDYSVDKHSTGGVGDKTTLIVAPIAAVLGCKVAKMTGRGLGHTGGTADKLESIPGFQITLSPNEFLRQVDKIGIAVTVQSGNLAPADKKLYALRDVTATVQSTPLIASSIMSKKLASGAKSIVLDVKIGSGAFNKTLKEAHTLAKAMINIGTANGRNMAAVITDMNMPLGHNIGNALELKEAISLLKCEQCDDLRAVCVALASNMVRFCTKTTDTEAKALVNDAIDSGKALQKFREWIAAQGGDVHCIDDFSVFPEATVKHCVYAKDDGYISQMNAEEIGLISTFLGAGREKIDDVIDYSAGIVLIKKPGDFVHYGDLIAVLHTNTESKALEAAEHLRKTINISNAPPKKNSLIYEVM